MQNRIIFIRKEQKLTLKDVSSLYAVRFGKKLSVATLRKIETDTYEPVFAVYLNLADLFGVTVDYLLCRADAPLEEVRFRAKGMIEPTI